MVKVKRGDPEEILKWFNEMPKDEEFAKLLDEIVEKNKKKNENRPNLKHAWRNTRAAPSHCMKPASVKKRLGSSRLSPFRQHAGTWA
jgi:hypothetical protein